MHILKVSKILRLRFALVALSASGSVYSGGGKSSTKLGIPSRFSGNIILNRSRNLFLAASAEPLDPSVVFLRIEQLRFKASQAEYTNSGIAPSKVTYQVTKISENAVFTRHWKIRGGVGGW
jgi:hypothetical protein